MTDEDYMARSKGAHQRLEILRGQVEKHLAKARADISIDAIIPVVESMAKICDELTELDRKRWG